MLEKILYLYLVLSVHGYTSKCIIFATGHPGACCENGGFGPVCRGLPASFTSTCSNK